VTNTNRRALLAQAALLLCGILWGSGFVVMKNSLDSLPITWLLALRFLLAAIALCAVLYKKILRADRTALIGGAICGTLMYVAYLVQTIGLKYTTAGNNAFLTAVYVVLVPFLCWIMNKKRPALREIAAGCLCLAGVGFIALTARFTVNIGDAVTILCGVLYAMHIVCVSYFTQRGVDVLLLTALQFAATALAALPVALVFAPFPSAATLCVPATYLSLLYLGFGCTLLALVLQNIGIRYAPPAHASLLMSTEALFGALFGVLFLQEPVSVRFGVGAALIIGSIVLSQTGQHARSQSACPAVSEGRLLHLFFFQEQL
jgi:drug/metabolite transporter (DMT)-like permease